MNNNLVPIQEDFYLSIQNQFVTQLDEESFRREVNFAIQLFKSNSYLQGCNAQTVLDAVLNISQTGLTLNPVLNYAYLVPRWSTKNNRLECNLDPGYQGLIKLATDTGSIKSIEVQLIYEGDLIEIDMASDKKVKKHIPYFLNGKEKGQIIAGYSLAQLTAGGVHIEIMSKKDIEDIRSYSESWKAFKAGKIHTCVWDEKNSASGEMYRKTILKRHFKYLPKSHVPEQLEKAIDLSNSDFDFPMNYNQATYIESLLMTSAIPEPKEREIYQAMATDDYSSKQAQEVIKYLKENQRDPVASGDHYNMGDIQNKLTSFKEGKK